MKLPRGEETLPEKAFLKRAQVFFADLVAMY